MKLEKIYTVRYESYDYFGGHKIEFVHFKNPKQVVAYVKKGNYSFDDGTFSRCELLGLPKWNYTEPRQPKHGLVLGHAPQKELDWWNWQEVEDIVI